MQVKVKAKSGMTNTGTPLLKESDGDGEYEVHDGWVFAADFAESGGVWIALKKPNCIIKKL